MTNNQQLATSNQPAPGSHVLVTGATGFTGQVLVRKLCGMGLKVRAIARESSDVSALKDLDIEWCRGDVYDQQTVSDAAKDIEYIFHVAAAYRDAGITDEDYQKVHVESTKLLATAVAGREGFKRFVHTSTVGVHGHIENPPIDEEGPFNPGDIYQETKLEAEKWIHSFAAEKNLPYTVIRPAAIYGPGDKRLLKVFKMAVKPLFVLLGNGKCLYHLIHVEDLTDVMILAATHPDAQGEAFIVGSPAAVTLEEMGRVIAARLGVKHKVIRLPVGPFFLAGDICESVCKPLGISPPIYRRRVAFFTKDRSFDTKKLRDKLGYKCKYTDEEGLGETAEWYREKGWL
ncbi:oxidoreductase [bacterium E08(2017)]|nr:oxidoreductase [bacterium E08(2017)]